MRLSFAFIISIVSVSILTVAHPLAPDFKLKGVRHGQEIAVANSPARDATLQRRGNIPPYGRTKNTKVSRPSQQARKAHIHANVHSAQARNAARKHAIAAAPRPATTLRPSRRPVKLSRKGKVLTPPGHRAQARNNGKWLPKQPKNPKPPTPKGSPITEKQRRGREESMKRGKMRLAESYAKYATAAAAYKNTHNLPPRLTTFKTPGLGTTFSGKHVRTAVFNSHYFSKNNRDPQPRKFRNREQGPLGNKHVTLPHMQGSGHEYPINHLRNGHQGEDKGPARVITQSNNGNHNLVGVISHDETRAPGQQGHGDHFQLHPQPHVNDPYSHGDLNGLFHRHR